MFLLYPVGQIILSNHTQRARLHPKIHIFGNKRHKPLRILILNPNCHSQNPMVLNIILKATLQLQREWMINLHPKSTQPLAKRKALSLEKILVGTEDIYLTHKLSCIIPKHIGTLLKLVQLLYNGNRYNKVILLEIINRPAVVQDNIGIQHKNLRQPRLAGLHIVLRIVLCIGLHVYLCVCLRVCLLVRLLTHS